MFGQEIKTKKIIMSSRCHSEKGAILVTSLILSVCLFGLVLATTTISSLELTKSRRSINDVKAVCLAESGIEQSIHFLNQAVKKTDFFDPMLGLHNLFNGNTTITPFTGEEVTESGFKIGEFSVSLNAVEDAEGITITIESTGYIPAAPANLPPGRQVKSWSSLSATVRYEPASSGVFDYAYFINNWGWFYGNTIECNGNVRSNGQFDAAGYKPSVNCQPLYDKVTWDGVNATLSGYADDNNDGLHDGRDGGVFSGWDIANAQNLRGQGGQAGNQHDFVDPVKMPNLTDSTKSETKAIAGGGNIKIGGSTMTNAVYGDEVGELDNLYLVGTAADPIEIKGQIIVRGDVIISGPVTGQGAIYAGGNIYVPDSVSYKNPPATTRPVSNKQADTEAWLKQNWNCDFLGLFATENVVVGDHTNATWRHYVNGWMSNSMNKSEEDAGEDNIPNTSKGKDGTGGTADDDLLEDDGLFTVEYYSEDDLTLGLIPPGKNVGDVIPGSGEDIDGDGIYDNTINITDDVDFQCGLNDSNWGGNMPMGGISYSSIASLYANNLDAVFYTNHSFCYVVMGSDKAKINGALVSRNEDIVYGTPTIEMNYDCRLLGGGAGVLSEYLPQTMKPVQILRWHALDYDPNKYIVFP